MEIIMSNICGRVGITGAFGVPGENDNGRGAVEFCAERGLRIGNTYFKHDFTYVHKGDKGSR